MLFRSREALLRLNIFSSYSYTLESIIQAGRKEIPMAQVPIRTNEKLRESRLIKNIFSYIVKSTSTILRVYLMYEPLKTFFNMGVAFLAPGILLILRFLYFYFTENRSGHIQSLIIAAIFVVMGCGIILLGFLGDIISVNRKINEDILYRVKKSELK